MKKLPLFLSLLVVAMLISAQMLNGSDLMGRLQQVTQGGLKSVADGFTCDYVKFNSSAFTEGENGDDKYDVEVKIRLADDGTNMAASRLSWQGDLVVADEGETITDADGNSARDQLNIPFNYVASGGAQSIKFSVQADETQPGEAGDYNNFNTKVYVKGHRSECLLELGSTMEELVNSTF